MNDFPPLYTLQPNAASRAQQLRIWREIVLSSGLDILSPLEGHPIFRNVRIDRQLSPEGCRAVADALIASEHAIWADEAHTSLRIFSKTSATLAQELFAWALSDSGSDSIYTLYELYAGDELSEQPFHGCDPQLLLKALETLQAEGKCTVWSNGDSLDEYGVKFSPK